MSPPHLSDWEIKAPVQIIYPGCHHLYVRSLGLKAGLYGFRGEDDARTEKAEGRNGSQLGRETGAGLERSEAETTFSAKGLL